MDQDLATLNLIQLELAVRRAAEKAAQQISSLPRGCDVPFEIADDFGNWCRWALHGVNAPTLSNEQRASLTALESRFARMSGGRNAGLWTEQALYTRAEWNHVRQDARHILDVFRWSLDERQED